MFPFKCNVISGSSNSSSEYKIEPFLENIFNSINLSPQKILKVWSPNKSCIEDSIDFMFKQTTGTNFLFIGKSLGGVKTWWMFQEKWNFINSFIREGSKIRVVLLDPHGFIVGDGTLGSYGVTHKKLFFFEPWKNKINIKCIYQTNKYPKGAFLDKNIGNNIHLNQEADHWNILDFNSSTGKIVSNIIKQEIQLLIMSKNLL